MGFLLSSLRPVASFALATSSNLGQYRYHLLHNVRQSVTRLREQPLKQQQQQPYSTHTAFSDDIIDKYDAFILDQFGVMHNGINSLEGAVELVEYLFKKGKKLIILSNTSAPADKALAKLPKFGFDPSNFVGAVTSGEESSRYILETYGSCIEGKPSCKALMITWDASQPDNPRLTAPPEAFLEQCGNVEVAASVEEADFLLLHGSEVWYRADQEPVSLSPYIEMGSFEALDPLLEQCINRSLPAVCANPDFVVQTPSGDGVAYMPGKIAERYQEMGGSCRTFGKPAVEHFEACIRKLGIDKSLVAHVGDSLHHDIAGAVEAGIPNVFVTSGIHRQQLQTKFGKLPELDILEKLLQEESVQPTHVIPAFRL